MSLLAEIASRLGYLVMPSFYLRVPWRLILKMQNCDLITCSLAQKTGFCRFHEQAKILCERFPDNLTYKAQMAIEKMQNGDYEQAIDIFDRCLLLHRKTRTP